MNKEKLAIQAKKDLKANKEKLVQRVIRDNEVRKEKMVLSVQLAYVV